MAEFSDPSNPTESCCDGGVINPIGPLDSSIEPDEDDNGGITVEHSPDTNTDHDCACIRSDGVTDYNPPMSESSSSTHTEDDAESVCGRCLRLVHKIIRGVRSLWATRQTEDTKENRELMVKITLRELCIYLVFLIDLCIVTFGTSNSMTFYFTDAVTDLFINERAIPDDAQSTFRYINSADDWYNFASGPLIRGLYNTSMSGIVLNVTKTENDGSKVPKTRILIENQLLGLPRLRLLRVRNDSCDVNEDFKNLISTCYNVYTKDNEDHSTYGPGYPPTWTYNSPEELLTGDYWGRLAVYGGGGYAQDILNADTAYDTIRNLHVNNWLDRGTRVVFVDFSLYNPNVNLFCIVSLLCEFPATGGAIASWNVRTVKLLRYVSSLDYFIMACEVIFAVFILYYIVEEALEIKRNRWVYFTSFYNLLDLTIIATSLCCISFSIYRSVTVNQSISTVVNSMDKYVNLSDLGRWQLIFDCSLAITLFLVWMKMFKFISFNRTMNQLSVTMSSCFKEIASFTVMFFIVFLSFAQLGYLVFGSQAESYSTFDLALFTQFRILLGDFNFNELLNANRVLGPAYFILYVFFISFILLNMFLAIMNDAYAEVKADTSRKQHEFEMIDFFKKSYRKVLAKLKLRKRDKSVAGTSATGNKTDGRTAHFDQWRDERLREGYSEAQIVAVSNRYDVDIGRSVDRTELRKMQADLTRQKFAEKEDSDSLDMSDEEDDSSITKSGSRGRRADCHSGGRSGGRGVTHEEFSMLQRRVDRMEHSIGSIVSKIDAVLVKLEAMEQTKARRRETVGRLLDSIAESEGVTDESKRQHMERLVRDELERWDSESCISGPFEAPPPASSNSGRSVSRTRQDQTQDFYPGSNA